MLWLKNSDRMGIEWEHVVTPTPKLLIIILFNIVKIFKKYIDIAKIEETRSCSNIDWKSSNNTFI